MLVPMQRAATGAVRHPCLGHGFRVSDAVAIDPDRLQAGDAADHDRLETVGAGVEQNLAGRHDAVAVIARAALNFDGGVESGVLVIENRDRMQADVVDEGAQFVFRTRALEGERVVARPCRSHAR